MTPRAQLDHRLRSHRLSAPAATMTDAARHMLAVQSQDFVAGRWALGVRTRGSGTKAGPTIAQADRVFARGELVRAWTMRGTLHIIPARDLAWVLSVTADRQRRQAAGRHRDLGVDDRMLSTAFRVLRPALSDGGGTRAELFALLEAAGIDPRGQRGNHLLFALTIAGEICQGPLVPNGGGVAREQRFMLADEWIRESDAPADPLAELFVRYIDGHGPAGVADFAWWSGLTLGTSREAAERARARVDEIDDGVFAAQSTPRRSPKAADVIALPAFDEYYISYVDRTRVCASEQLAAIGPGSNGMVRATLIEHGRVIGTWSHADAARGSAPELFDGDHDPDAVASALARFAHFVEP
ncbi:winged helix DNA-binding domain-containing protein [Microbacterium sp. ARD32]|uniref:winged helix DNA-binding domain-containing protein n=1 Tax=Microbacterium sp. ARD32 TaxID=2962577 RepID=UPI00288136D4|nr:winged helix DNA-binding domain-containing protein [Microbacterium sp. ARD32]MDT0156551.1 winged helix DNA-binding domain-containing protein [Microbacterium sp. ARD32]